MQDSHQNHPNGLAAPQGFRPVCQEEDCSINNRLNAFDVLLVLLTMFEVHILLPLYSVNEFSQYGKGLVKVGLLKVIFFNISIKKTPIFSSHVTWAY